MPEQNRCPVCNAPLAKGAAVCERCGFKLVGRTEQFPVVDQTGGNVEPHASTPHNGNPTLTILKGPMAGQEFHLTSFPLVVGRDPSCDLFLNDMTVTRKHASIDIIDNEVVITDLNSLNGTWVDGQVRDSAVLKNGTIVQIGTFTMGFNI
ncbi:MAG: FHA domain-containing protein [Coriobacteriales bacterium]|jgi:hypothetical protein